MTTTSNQRGWPVKDWQLLFFALTLIALCLMFGSCVTQEKCWKKFPPIIHDSTVYREVYHDTVLNIAEDSATTRYLVECEKNGEGYKARIRQLLTQAPGTHLQAPTAVITGNVLTASAQAPAWEYRYQIKTIDRAVYRTSVYVKITNTLTGWQWAQVWAGRLMIGLVLLLLALVVVRRYFPFKL